MHARVSTVEGASQIDEGVAFIREEGLPVARQQKGFRGISISANRETGTVSILSLWETGADLEASESAMGKTREEAAAVFGGRAPTVERFEQLLLEMGSTPPDAGSKLLIRRVKMDPAKIDENLEFFRSTILPDITSQAGFQAVRNMINRSTGEGVVGSVWSDEASLQEAVTRAKARQSNAAARGVELGEMTTREVLFSAMN